MINRFDKGQMAEINELFDGTYSSVRELASIFKISEGAMRLTLDYKGYRKTHHKSIANWRINNPERAKEIDRKSYLKWYRNHRTEILKRHKEKYWENIKKSREKGRNNYIVRKLKGRKLKTK